MQREAFLQRLNLGINQYEEILAQVNEGYIFYRDLCNRLAQLTQLADDHKYIQSLQRREYQVKRGKLFRAHK